MSPLKIAFLNLNSGPHGEYGALLAAAVASQHGVDVLSIVPRALAQSDRAKQSLNSGRVHTIRSGRHHNMPRDLWSALSALRRFKPDIIHDPVGSGTGLSLPLRPLLPSIATTVLTEHNPMPHEGMTGWHHGVARAASHRWVDLFHVHGPNAFRDMRSLGIPEDRLVVVRHGAFDEYSEQAAQYSREGSCQILLFGALRPNKGIDLLPRILSRVRELYPRASIVVAGKRPKRIDGVLGARMDAALRELAADPLCQVRDERIPDWEVPKLFGSCAICLLPYHSATQSGVAMIAMATGAPVVATNVGDLPDIIEDNVVGLMAAPDPDAIAERVIEALSSPDDTRERAERARRFVREHCAWPKIGEQMLAAYRKQLDGKQTRKARAA